MEDFIVEYIPENSVNINEHEFIQHNKKILIKFILLQKFLMKLMDNNNK